MIWAFPRSECSQQIAFIHAVATYAISPKAEILYRIIKITPPPRRMPLRQLTQMLKSFSILLKKVVKPEL